MNPIIETIGVLFIITIVIAGSVVMWETFIGGTKKAPGGGSPIIGLKA